MVFQQPGPKHTSLVRYKCHVLFGAQLLFALKAAMFGLLVSFLRLGLSGIFRRLLNTGFCSVTPNLLLLVGKHNLNTKENN